MKKFISLCLSICMLFSITAGIDFSAYAAIATLCWPVHDSNGKSIITLSQGFSNSHNGIDISNSSGCKWYAPIDCTIDTIFTGCKSDGYNTSGHTSCSPNHGRYSMSTTINGKKYSGQYCNNGAGNGVILKATISGTTYYFHCAHMNSVSGSLSVGNKIKAGTYLGTVGNKGFSFGTHAHFAVSKGQKWNNNIDPKSNFNYYYDLPATQYTVTFNGNGGTVNKSSLTVNKGSAMWTSIAVAKRTGYTFNGWYTTATGGDKINADTTINKNMTVYAHWYKNSTDVLSEGAVYRIYNKNSNLALQATGDADGSAVVQSYISSNSRQLWKLVSKDNGYYYFACYANGKYLDVKGKSEECKAEMQIYGSSKQDNRAFSIISRGNGYYSIHPKHSALSLDVRDHSTTSGELVQQYYYNGSDNQKFYFELVGVPNVDTHICKGHLAYSYKATCVTYGYTGDYVCDTCGKTYMNGSFIEPKGHTVVIDKAIAPTTTSTGLTKGSHCSDCGEVFVAQTVVAKLSAPASAPTVKAVSVPKITLGTVKSKKAKQITVNWKKNTKVTGYEVQYSTDKNFKKSNKTVKVTKNKTTSTTIKKLKSKKKYYVRIRTYKTVNGKKYYSAWSKAKNVKVK